MVKPSLTSPLPTQRNKHCMKQSGLRDHSRGPWRQYNTNIVCDNWVLPCEQKAGKRPMELRLDSCIHGYHIYNEIWTVVAVLFT